MIAGTKLMMTIFYYFQVMRVDEMVHGSLVSNSFLATSFPQKTIEVTCQPRDDCDEYLCVKFNLILFIYLFRLFLKHLFKFTTTKRHSHYSTDTVSEFHAEASQTTVSEVLAQGRYVAARAGFEPTTLRTNGVDSTNGPPRPNG